MKRQWMIVWIAVLVMLSLGCSLFGGKPTAEPTAAPVGKEPAATTAPADSPAGGEDEDALLTLDENALEGLDSYRAEMIWSFTSEDGTVEEFSMQQEATRSPVAQRFVMDSQGEGIEFIQVGETQWMRFGEEWMQTAVSEGEAMGGFGEFLINPQQILSESDKDAYKYMGKETVNGLKTRHYRLKDKALNLAWGFNVTNIEEGNIDVWIVDERDLPKFTARYEMVVTGTFEEEDNKKGTLNLTWNIYDVNAPITIEPPAEAAGMGLPEGLELCPDASNVTVMGKISLFTCAGTVEDTATFYTDALENAGWEAGDVTNLEGMMMGTWSKGDETLSLTITADAESGGSSVMLTLGE